MRRTLKLILALTAMAGSGSCSTDPGAPQTEFNGLKYTAEIAPNGFGFTVIVTLQNPGGTAQTRTYPAACPVRIRLYRTANNLRLYDETTWPCSATPLATITIDGFSSKTLQSGARSATTVAGDSLPHTTYTVFAVVLTEGATLVEIRAGTYTL
jgi:hypothetical protein